MLNIKTNLTLLVFVAHSSLLLNGLRRVECSTLANIPRVFHESVLPAAQRDGQFVEDLGHIIKLDTYLAPKHVDKYETRFTVFNRQRTNGTTFVFRPKKYCIPETCYGPYQYDLVGMANSGFDPSLKTVMMISGFLSGDEIPWMQQAKESWLELEDVNIIWVMWKKSNEYVYSVAVAETTLVARQITIFLHYLAELHGRHLVDESYAKSIHFVGFSLGAHVAAFVGQDLGGKMGRITGLDPAGPSFDMMPRSRRLDSTDAQLVDIIHTNSGKLHYTNMAASGVAMAAAHYFRKLPLLGRVASYLSESSYSGAGDTAWFGIDAKVGHLDYYANDGRVQPGCSDLIHSCDHGRSHVILNDILLHEVQLKRLKVDRANGRLLAFRSDGYENFISGLTFANKCPDLIGANHRLPLNLLRQISAPIDLITEVDTLKWELRNVHNLDLDHAMNEQENFYFTTHLEQILVGDQHLLKIALDKPDTDDWDESCALKVEITLSSGAKSLVEFNKQLPAFEMIDFFGLAIPFAGSIGSRSMVDSNTNSSSSVGQIKALVEMLPHKIQLSISAASSTGILEATRRKLTKLLTLGYAGQASQSCRLSFKSLEVIPILDGQQKIAAMYGSVSTLGSRSNTIRVAKLTDRNELTTRGQTFQLNPINSPDGILLELDTLLIE